MKNILQIFVLVLLIFSCAESKKKNYLTFSGRIENIKGDSIVIQKLYKRNKKRVIKLAEDGSFKDTLTIEDGFHYIFMGKVAKKVYFQNGDDIKITADLNDYDETVKFSGKGIEEIKFMQKEFSVRYVLYEEEDFMNLPETDFTFKRDNYVTEFNELLKDEALDSAFVVSYKKTIKGILEKMSKSFKENLYIKNELKKGAPSPKFTNFINHKGGTASLDDFKGTYVYVDFWATWCKPCIGEFPALQNLIEKYKNKDIEFVSVYYDGEKHIDEWRKFVAQKNLKGIQLLANENGFAEAYKVTNIPRYILIDPKGNIVDAQTFSPSSPKLVSLFTSLGL